MDVILDTNIFLEDPAFKRNQFRELFSYLKRTKSRMVIPTLVRDEACERYRDRLRDCVNRTKSGWTQVKQLASKEYADPEIVDIDEEVELLIERLTSPTQDLQESLFIEMSSIDINQVTARAVKRIKPANSNGEELRDVMIWLVVLYYAKKAASSVAFLSSDGDFRVSKDDKNLHPDLKAELISDKLDVSFHTDIASFITAHSLEQRPITEPYLSKILDISNIQDEAARLLIRRAAAYGVVEKSKIESLSPINGTEYKVSTDSLYLELMFEGRVAFRIRPNYHNYLLTQNFTPSYPGLNLTEPASDPGALNSFLEGYLLSPSVPLTGMIEPINLFTPNATAPGASIYVAPAVDYKFLFNLEVSARIEKSSLVSWQIDRLEMGEDGSH